MDDGPGVAPADVEHLFDAFFTTKPPSDGTGLGLPVSAGIVRSHGGELRYVPSALGRGAAFTFDLPVRGVHDETGPRPTDPAAQVADVDTRPAAPPPPEAPVAIERPLILVVDDEPSIRALIMRALPTMGYEPVSAESGAQALDIIASRQVAAVLCDHHMAGMSGLAVYDAVIAARPGLRGHFVMMSGDAQNPDLAAFTASHDIKVLSKPFQLDDLRDIAAEATGVTGSGQSRG
jgi:two-component system NtrC family sensor kinase